MSTCSSGISNGVPYRGLLVLMLTASLWCTITYADDQQTPSWPPQIFANGDGLPAGGGSGAIGEGLFREHCAACHGQRGEGGRAVELVGDRSLLATEYPDRGIAVLWPYAPPLFDYVQRAMPPDRPYSLSADETYSIVAWLLVLNELATPDQWIDANGLSGLEMPNREGFEDWPR